jgi:hypothetical protein
VKYIGLAPDDDRQAVKPLTDGHNVNSLVSSKPIQVIDLRVIFTIDGDLVEYNQSAFPKA